MDPRMDRGLVRVEGMALDEYRDHILDMIIPASPLGTNPRLPDGKLLGYFQVLFQLHVSWLSGLSSASTLLTCLGLYRECSIADPRLRWMMEALRRAALLTADLVMQSNVARPDEFFSSLHGLVEDSSDKFTTRLISTWPMCFRKEIESTPIYEESFRMYLWLRFLQLLKMGRLEYSTMLGLLESLMDSPLGDVTATDLAIFEKELYIIPEVSNLYGVGCVRRGVGLKSFRECQLVWRLTVENLRSAISLYHSLASFWKVFSHLMRTFSSPASNPTLRSLCFVSMLVLLMSSIILARPPSWNWR